MTFLFWCHLCQAMIIQLYLRLCSLSLCLSVSLSLCLVSLSFSVSVSLSRVTNYHPVVHPICNIYTVTTIFLFVWVFFLIFFFYDSIRVGTAVVQSIVEDGQTQKYLDKHNLALPKESLLVGIRAMSEREMEVEMEKEKEKEQGERHDKDQDKNQARDGSSPRTQRGESHTMVSSSWHDLESLTNIICAFQTPLFLTFAYPATVKYALDSEGYVTREPLEQRVEGQDIDGDDEDADGDRQGDEEEEEEDGAATTINDKTAPWKKVLRTGMMRKSFEGEGEEGKRERREIELETRIAMYAHWGLSMEDIAAVEGIRAEGEGEEGGEQEDTEDEVVVIGRKRKRVPPLSAMVSGTPPGEIERGVEERGREKTEGRKGETRKFVDETSSSNGINHDSDTTTADSEKMGICS